MAPLRNEKRASARTPTGLLLALALALPGAAAAANGVKAGDVDTKAEACTDFYQYANGKWRAENPIPSYMDRWSRRWASGETNKENLKNILVEVSARTDWPAGTPEQLIGDHYAACMNEAAIDKAGIAPAEPMLKRIDGVADKAALQDAITELARLGVAAPFIVIALQDLHDPTAMIAHVAPGGLGLPDRDYYLKPDKRFVEARAKYLQHVAKTFELAGGKPAAARKAADTVFAFEKKLAEASGIL